MHTQSWLSKEIRGWSRSDVKSPKHLLNGWVFFPEFQEFQRQGHQEFQKHWETSIKSVGNFSEEHCLLVEALTYFLRTRACPRHTQGPISRPAVLLWQLLREREENLPFQQIFRHLKSVWKEDRRTPDAWWRAFGGNDPTLNTSHPASLQGWLHLTGKLRTIPNKLGWSFSPTVQLWGSTPRLVYYPLGTRHLKKLL